MFFKELTYTFKPITKCNMCHAGPEQQKKIGRRLNGPNGKNPKNKVGISVSVIRCKTCGLIYSNPQPIPADIAMHYDLPVTDYYKEEFLDYAVEGRHFPNEIDFVKTFKEHFKAPGKPKVLDIGAGIGATLLAFKKECFDIYGLEPSRTFYEKSKQFLGEDSYKMKNSSFEDANYANEEFDFIYAFNVLEHVYDPNQMIVQALKWLKPGGLLGLVIPSSKWLTSKLLNLYYRLCGTDLVTNISPMHVPFHLYEFSPECFLQNGKINNYTVVETRVVHTETYLPKALDIILDPVMRATNSGVRLDVIIRKKL